MDPRLLRYYSRELQHVREMGGEFARQYPKIAGRLGMEGLECADPYVERLLEGFAFLAARVQLKLDAQQPVFSQHLLEMLYPHYLAPIPSMAVVQFHPDGEESVPPAGHVVPRHTALRSQIGPGERSACEYRTAHALTLWPLRLQQADYLATPAAIAAAGVAVPAGLAPRAALRLRFATAAGVRLDMLPLDELPIHLLGADALPWLLHEQLLGHAAAYTVRAAAEGDDRAAAETFPAQDLHAPGFAEDQALLPYDGRSFSGYRLLQEYFACPQRYLFIAFRGLRRVLARAKGDRFEIVVWLRQRDERLEGAIDADNFRLFCTPAVNLFERRADRIHLRAGATEYHVLGDRTRPMDFEVHSVADVEGFGDRQEPERRFAPFYGGDARAWHDRQGAFYTLRREPRLPSSRQRRQGARSSYIGSEVFLALVDARQAPYSSRLRQLGMRLLCSNRDLPLHMPVGRGQTDFHLDIDAPVAAIRCVAGPSRPRQAPPSGETTWRLISHLQSNYLALLDEQGEGALALREILGLYVDDLDQAGHRQIEGIKRVQAVPVVRRLPVPGPISYGRGLEVTVTCEDAAFEGTSAFLLGAVLQHIFSRQVSVNSFTETVMRTSERNEVARWPARLGKRQIL